MQHPGLRMLWHLGPLQKTPLAHPQHSLRSSGIAPAPPTANPTLSPGSTLAPEPEPEPEASPTPSPEPTGSTATGGSCAARWAKCGGEGFSGPTCCEGTDVCNVQTQWYSQCVPKGSLLQGRGGAPSNSKAARNFLKVRGHHARGLALAQRSYNLERVPFWMRAEDTEGADDVRRS